MTRADLLRQRANDAELRARALADQADAGDPDARQASDAEAVAARVLLELAGVEDELGEAA